AATGLKTAMTTAGTIPLPLAASGAQAGTYVPGFVPVPVPSGTAGCAGYWQPSGTPVITGYIKIDAQTAYGSPCGTWKDVTQEILSLGYAGRNINPVPQSLDGSNLNPMWGNSLAYAGKMDLGRAPALPALPSSLTPAPQQLSYQNAPAMGVGAFTGPSTNPATPGYSAGTCLDPHPNAVIRLERIRDNPSSVPVQNGPLTPGNKPLQSTVAQVCGVDPATGTLLAGWTPQTYDFWPNVLFDTREGYNRETPPTAPFNSRVTLGGVMNYVELDVNNLAKWFSGAIGSSGPSTRDPNVAPNNFVVYVSDRRGNYAATGTIAGAWPPLSPSGHETGEYGYSDFVNPADIKGCPNNTLDIGEDLDGTGVLYTYGENSFALPATAASLF